jgi:hypothetical protein
VGVLWVVVWAARVWVCGGSVFAVVGVVLGPQDPTSQSDQPPVNPINVWAEGTDNKKSTRSEAVNTAQSEGNVVVRFASDSTPHPSVFEALARHFGGTLLEVCDDKFNTAAMGCLIKFSAEVWSSSVLPTVADAFSISDTVWLATPLRHKTKV